MPVSRLELRRVSKTYRNGGQPAEVLHDITLAPAAGAVTALVGRSGCGKTTLLHLAGAMDFPTAGEVLIDGRATGALSDAELTALRRTRIGFVFQFFQLLPTLTAVSYTHLRDEVAFPSRDRRERNAGSWQSPRLQEFGVSTFSEPAFSIELRKRALIRV